MNIPALVAGFSGAVGMVAVYVVTHAQANRRIKEAKDKAFHEGYARGVLAQPKEKLPLTAAQRVYSHD